jgi:hypothetical protein
MVTTGLYVDSNRAHQHPFSFYVIGNMGSVGIIFERVFWRRSF